MAVTEQAREAAANAAGLLFRDLAVDFPLNVSVVRSYADAGKPGSVTVAVGHPRFGASG